MSGARLNRRKIHPALMQPFIVTTQASTGSQIKTVNGLAVASVKTWNGLPWSSVKKWNGLAAQ